MSFNIEKMPNSVKREDSNFNNFNLENYSTNNFNELNSNNNNYKQGVNPNKSNNNQNYNNSPGGEAYKNESNFKYNLYNENNSIDTNYNQNELPLDKDEIKNFCYSIFMNFSKFCKEEFQFMLTYQNLVKILRLVNLVGKDDQIIKNYEIDALLKKANPNNKKYTLKQFMNFIVFLSNRLEPETFKQDPKLSLFKTIKRYFEPLNNYIEEQINNGMAGDYFQHTIAKKYLNHVHIDSNIILVINSVYSGLKNLYMNYFYLENKHMKEIDKIERNSLEGLLDFCRDFEILNHIASIDKIVTYFNFLNEMSQEDITKNADCPEIFDKQKDLGKIFTLSRFTGFLVHIAIIFFEKKSKYLENLVKRRKSLIETGINIDDMGNAEKFILLLDKLDSGEGIKILEKKSTKGYTSKISLMPSIETMMTVILFIILKNFVNKDNKINKIYKY